MNRNFSVCMSVYKNDNPNHFLTAVRSIANQTVSPNEIIIVIDGPITDQLENALHILLSEFNIIKLVRFKENRGHAVARQAGVDNASNELLAIMDADDISMPHRFELQLKAIEQYPDVSVVGGYISEFIETTDNVVSKRLCPQYNDEIVEYLKYRCPMNLVTVMMKKSDINAVGGFIEWYCEEDYFLWVRLALQKYKFFNIQENLVNVRVGSDMYKRRGGWKYFHSEAKLQKYMWRKDIISLQTFCYNVVARFVVQVVLPNWLRGYVYQKMLRN